MIVGTIRVDGAAPQARPFYLGAALDLAPSPFVPLPGDRVLVVLCRPRVP